MYSLGSRLMSVENVSGMSVCNRARWGNIGFCTRDENKVDDGVEDGVGTTSNTTDNDSCSSFCFCVFLHLDIQEFLFSFLFKIIGRKSCTKFRLSENVSMILMTEMLYGWCAVSTFLLTAHRGHTHTHTYTYKHTLNL